MPRELDLTKLHQFEPQQVKEEGRAEVAPAQPAPVAAPAWPSREPSREGQISIKGPEEILERFKKICKDDRRPYYDMLSILMDKYEGKS